MTARRVPWWHFWNPMSGFWGGITANLVFWSGVGLADWLGWMS